MGSGGIAVHDAGSIGGDLAGSFRHSRILPATAGSSMAAIKRSVEPQRGQRKASISKTRWSNSAQR
jgi:hypothetical protein